MRKCKVIVFSSQKGGSSKSMLCRCLSVAAERAGDGPAAIIDTDPQGTTAKWYRRREAETPVLLNIKSIKGELLAAITAADNAGIKYIFIDTQGALTDTIPEVGKHADFILIPVKASPDDIDAIPDTLEVVQPLKRPFGFMLTQVKQQALITGEAKINVAQFGLMCPTIMGDRVDYPGAVTDGRTVLETDPGGRSAAEMMELWAYLKGQLNKTGKTQKENAA
jgi:chromosome partitioning protein